MSKAMMAGGLADSAAADELRREQLSALMDGELDGEAWDGTLNYAAAEEGQACWQLYHLVGDVLRSPELAQAPSPAFMARLRDELAKEAPPAAAGLRTAEAHPVVVAPALAEAANASVFRWKMVAGVASLAAVAAIGWTSLEALQGPGPGAQMALSSGTSAGAAGAPVVAVADAESQQVMLRDPRLDELLAAHKQFGSTSALQMPAGFLRNATFETSGR